MQEVRARGARVIAVTTAGQPAIADASRRGHRGAGRRLDAAADPRGDPAAAARLRDRPPARPERRPAAQPRKDRHRRVAAAPAAPRSAGQPWPPARGDAGGPSSIASSWTPCPTGCTPLPDAEHDARASTAGRSRSAGVDGLDLMERAGAGVARARRARWPRRAGDGGVRQGQQRRRRARGRAPAARGRPRGDASCAWRRRRSSPATRARTSSACPGPRRCAWTASRGRQREHGERPGARRAAPRPRGSGGRRGRAARHRLSGRAPRRGRRGDRRDQPRRARRSSAWTCPAAWTPPAASSAARRCGPSVTVTLPRGQAGPVDQPRQGARGRGRDDRHRHPARRPAQARVGLIEPAVLGLLPRAGRARPSSAPGTCSWRAARAG